MTLSNIVLIFTFICNLLLGFFVLCKNRRNSINISYFLLALGVSLWAITNTIFQITENSQIAFIDAIIAYYAGALIALPFFYFSLVFPQGNSNIKKYHNWIIGIWSLIWFFVITIPDITLKDVSLTKPVKGLITGPGLFFHFISIAVLMLSGLINLFIKFLKSQGTHRQQIMYVLIGVSVMTVFGILFNLILPLQKNYSFVWLGPIFSIFMLIAIAYAIVRYHLMDIWVVIQLGTIFTLLFAVISFIYVFIGSMIGQYFDHTISHFISSFIIVIGFIPLKNFIEFSTDKIFFQKRYKFADVISRLENIIHQSGLNLDKILGEINNLIARSIKVRAAAILTLTPRGYFVSRQTIGETIGEINLSPDNPIVSYFKSNKEHALDTDTFRPDSVKENSNLADAIEELKQTGFSFAIPIEHKGELIGIYLLKQKMSLDPFTKEDVRLLKHISAEMAFAIDNARMFEELQKLDRTKSEFISVASHQLRTPVSIIKWNLELIFDKKTTTGEKNELLGTVYENIDAIGQHFDKLMTALEIEDKNILTEKKKNCLKSLILKSLKKFEKELTRRYIETETDFMEEVPSLEFDFDKINKSVEVIVQNAVTYTPKGGKIKIGWRKKQIGDKNCMVVYVSDSGIGISEQDCGNIFKKFFRSQGARNVSPNGFGLGLFIAKKFINAHGGDIWFESQGENSGATFYFSLPIENEQVIINS